MSVAGKHINNRASSSSDLFLFTAAVLLVTAPLVMATISLTPEIQPRKFITPRRNTVYVEYNKRRLVHYLNEDNDCEIVAGKVNVFFALGMLNLTLQDATSNVLDSRFDSGSKNLGVVLVGRASMRRLIDLCGAIQASVWARIDVPLLQFPSSSQLQSSSALSSQNQIQNQNGPSQWTKNKKFMRGLLIFPGTKWCGAGDVADSYNDLGYHRESDKCCRQHDLCITFTGEYLAPQQCKHGLCNPSPFVRSPCRCDLQLGSCLRSAHNHIANLIGRTFFNVAGMSCFKYEYPIKRCAEYFQPPKSRLPPWVLSMTKVNDNPEGPRCKAYEYDLTKPKMWQFFETVYEETNSWMMTTDNPGRAFAAAGRRTLPFFQKMLVDFISLVLEPLE